MFGFLKDKLKQTVEKLTKEVDKATEEVVPTEEQKKEMIEEIKKEQKEEKGFFTRLKEKFTQKEEKEEATEEEIKEAEQETKEAEEVLEIEEKREKKEKEIRKAHKNKKIIEKKEVIVEEKKHVLKDEGYGIEVVKEAHKPEEIKKKIEEGEKEIEALAAKKEKEEQEHERKKKAEHKEEKGFFARLKEKFTHTEETEEGREKRGEEKDKKEELFKTTSDELKEFEEAFKEAETTEQEKKSTEEKEEIIPIITETEDGETVVELHKRHGKEEPRKKHTEKEEKHFEPKVRNALETQKEFQMKQEKKSKEEPSEETEEEQGGFFSALKDTIFKTSLSEEKFEELFWDLELILLENNVAVEVIDLIKVNLKKELVEKKILRGQINDIIIKTLRKSVEQTFDVEAIDIIEKVREKKPYVIVFVGINGSGKTTTIAKMIQKLKDNNLSCVVAAGDTFRAAAIQQLEEHTTRLNVKLIKHDYGSDPAAVGFDAIKYAQAHKVDCVLIDTAGRLHSNVNLMDEMKKIIRVTKPDMKIFIGEAITGNDCVDQARKFHEAVGIDGIILAKADVDEKGGAALSISYVTKKPILYLGTGQEYSDLEAFDKEKIMEQLGLA